MLKLRLSGTLQFRNDARREDFAQLHAPLIEGVDGPNRTLREDAMFLEGHQRAHDARRQFFSQDRIGRPVALANAEWSLKVGRTFGLQFLGGLAESQRLGLREQICHQ